MNIYVIGHSRCGGIRAPMSMQDEVHAYRSILAFCMSHIFEVNNNINADMFIAWLTQSAFYASHVEWII